MSKIVLGIDVSKKSLDAALIFNGKTFCRQFKNSEEGFKLLAAWLRSLKITELHACLEATGSYSEAVALFLHEQGHRVSIVNRLPIKGYAQSNLQRNKTDRLDACLIARVLFDTRASRVDSANSRNQTSTSTCQKN